MNIYLIKNKHSSGSEYQECFHESFERNDIRILESILQNYFENYSESDNESLLKTLIKKLDESNFIIILESLKKVGSSITIVNEDDYDCVNLTRV